MRTQEGLCIQLTSSEHRDVLIDDRSTEEVLGVGYKHIMERIRSRTITVGVIGLGYVGLPLALLAARAGCSVVGFDVDAEKVSHLQGGRSSIRHISSQAVDNAIKSGRFEMSTDFDRLGEPDILIICVPTPLTKHREPDLSYVEATTRSIARRLRPGQLVVLESTTYPGTTEELVKPILEATGLLSGRDFFLAFSPEREDPGNERYDVSNIPKVVGGDGTQATALAEALYGLWVSRTLTVSSTATSEAVKLTENIFRSVNIALVNELKVVFSAMGIDIWEVIDAASTKPFGFMPFYPGPGLGGHCIPVDPFYLTWRAREFDITTRFIELAGEINSFMPYYVVDTLTKAVDRGGRPFSGSKILLLGVAYKKNVDDLRESPSLKLIELIEKRGALVDFHDPFIEVIPPTHEYPQLAGRRSIQLSAEHVANYDAVLIATDHDSVDYRLVVEFAKIVVDTRNVCTRLGLSFPHVVKS